MKVKFPCCQNYFHENLLNEHLFIVHKGKDLKVKTKVNMFNRIKKRKFETIKNIIKDLEEHRKKTLLPEDKDLNKIFSIIVDYLKNKK